MYLEVYRCAGLLSASIHRMLKRGRMLAFGDVTCRKSDGIPIGWREQLVRGPASMKRTVSFFSRQTRARADRFGGRIFHGQQRWEMATQHVQ